MKRLSKNQKENLVKIAVTCPNSLALTIQINESAPRSSNAWLPKLTKLLVPVAFFALEILVKWFTHHGS